MKHLIFIGAFVCASTMMTTANAQTPIKLERVKKFVSSKKACHLAVGAYFFKNQGTIENTVLCVMDMKVGEGTINEREGCTLAYFDVTRGTYLRLHSARGWDHSGLMPIAENKSCASGGFEKLLTMPAYQTKIEQRADDKIVQPAKFASVKEFLLYAHNAESKDGSNQVLVSSDSEKYKKWWKSNAK